MNQLTAAVLADGNARIAHPNRMVDLGVLPSVSLVERDPGYQCRFPVPDRLISWDTAFPSYNPPEAVEGETKKRPAASAAPVTAPSFEGPVPSDPDTSLPRNVMGRTGLRERGRLWNWGPNHAADPIVLRPAQVEGRFEALLIRRANGQWAFPGGFVNRGESPIDACLRELGEEAVGNLKEVEPLLRERGRLIYQGYADDPRNTDNAWIETSAITFFLSRKESQALHIRFADDAWEVAWKTLTPRTTARLYAGHPHLAVLAARHAQLEGETLPQRKTPVRIASLRDLPPGTRRIGIFGGTFDLLHPGHLQAPEWAMRAHCLDAVVFVPTAQNPFKQSPRLSPEERAQGVEAVLSRWPGFFLSTHELTGADVGRASFTVDTLRHFHSQLKKGQTLHFIVGADVLPDLAHWKEWQSCMDLAEFIPIRRNGFTREQIPEACRSLGEAATGRLYRTFVDVPTSPLSSSQLRSVSESHTAPISGLLPPPCL